MIFLLYYPLSKT